MNDKKTLNFQTEVKQLLNLMIHSLYSNKEIFLRELISNASDALDKLKFELLNNTAITNNSELAITIDFDNDNKTLYIKDNGIGMSYDEVIENIGTIAKSGTRAFLEKLTKENQTNSNLIGQFGVGFYSAFIVAKEVEILTLKAGLENNNGVKWVSNGEGEYTIETITKEDGQGTTIILHLKDENEEFLNSFRLKNLISKYSNHINYPIKMLKEESDKDGKPIISTTYEIVNKANAIWIRNKNEITEEEYKEFYKDVAHEYSDPLLWTHSKVEGTQEYTLLLYIPSTLPFDLYDQHRSYGIKLFIKRVFIMDDAEKLLPKYLRFIRGIIDSQNLPLNISREILQSSKDIDSIRTGTTKKVLSLLEDIAKNDFDKYAKFYNLFGNVLKEGIIEDFSNKEKIAKLLRFTTNLNDNNIPNISLETYISRMKPNQDKIYYITAESYNAAKTSPHLEFFNQKGIEVLLLVDRIDEWVVGHLHEFDKKQLESITKAELDVSKFDDIIKNSEEKTQDDYKNLINKLNTILKDKIKEIKITNRLINSPSCLVSNNFGMSIHLEKLLKQAGQQVPESKATLEINPKHQLIQKINNSNNDKEINDLSLIIYEQAMLAEGLTLEDPNGFIKRVNTYIH